MDNKAKDFIEKWDAMIKATRQFEGEMDFTFEVRIESKDHLLPVREQMIAGINQSFANNGMRYESKGGA